MQLYSLNAILALQFPETWPAIFLLLAGLFQSCFPKQVMEVCEGFGKLTHIPAGPFADSAIAMRISGVVMMLAASGLLVWGWLR